MIKVILKKLSVLSFLFLSLLSLPALAQFGQDTYWSADGSKVMQITSEGMVETDPVNPSNTHVLIPREKLTPAGSTTPLNVSLFSFSDDRKKVIIFTNTKKVWRYNTRGDFWVYDLQNQTLRQLGNGKPSSSLMFAKFSPDGKKAAYVSGHNIYVEDLVSGAIKALTTDGSLKFINGTFDWVYEEELDCRDGFRWSPDSKSIAYWQLDATKTKNYLMLNTTDSLYPYTVPVEYPVVGEDPSLCRVGVVSANGGPTKWMNVPGDAVQHYIPRMEWAANSTELIIQQLNRRQNESKIILCNALTGTTKAIYTETDKAWVDAKAEAIGWTWTTSGKSFIWLSEKDGWKHIYSISRDGKEKLITKGDFDVISLNLVDEKNGLIYFMASPANATQSYLYKVKLNGSGAATRVTPAEQSGTHSYDISPNGKLAFHDYSNAVSFPVSEVVSLPDHKVIGKGEQRLNGTRALPKVEFFKVTTEDGIQMDGWMVKPNNFDPSKKYPIVYTVYGEPASQTVTDRYGVGYNRLYNGSMADDGYIYASLDGRGSPAPKGREWRKSIYRNIGIINIRDQAMGAKAMFKQFNFIDTSRVAVWGWSGGGSSTLNLLFQYPEIYKTGISVAAVDNQLNYDNIYQERYMGLLPEDREYFVKGSPLSHVQGLKGNLLLIHGTGDDNVHYNNAEQMINQLIKYNKPFQMIAYPNRTHSISEGEGTSKHLATVFTKFLKDNCPPGAK
ncbi:prolyl oligopeptidase family serine peptidase [Pedobacter sp. HMF7647]|uniref:Prolyl oligopeptidase family serine peptidase n=1 Tax=Hufsiella arboris TaxID=2695275 RepID=A0A7K1YAI6_9SPHI|nr:S9 family peptidase [Hufsiella arboris]MXV51596.1 prolyl oligopeptidase family serine peptidase [Hufsiella arboris]